MNKEDILKHVNELDIFQKYVVHDFTPGKAFLSEIREEKHPSANVFYASRAGRYLYKDFASHSLDAFGYVMKLYGVSFRDALDIVKQDFYLEDRKQYIRKPERRIPKLPKLSYYSRKTFFHKPIPWNKKNMRYFWLSGISLATLKTYNTLPVEYYYPTDFPHLVIKATDDKPIYLFQEGAGQKFYAPKHDKKVKFRNNMDPDKEIFGHSVLNDREPAIGIVGGNKDVLSFYEHLGVKCVSLNSESAHLMDWLYLDLKKRTNYLFMLYDNDKTGVLGMRKNAEKYDIATVYLSDILGYCTLKGSTWINDFTDYCERIIVKRNVSAYHIKRKIYNEIKKNQNKKLQENRGVRHAV